MVKLLEAAMRNITFAFAATVCLSTPASADRYPTGPNVASVVNQEADWFDEKYDPGVAQHLGRDYQASANQRIVSPIDGTVVVNETAKCQAKAYLVIRDIRENGVEHVLGHIRSSLAKGTVVKAGQDVGYVLPQGAGKDCGVGPHVHWGVNKLGVTQAMTNGWGWGRAPITATKDMARAKGWVKRSSDP